MDLFQIIYSSQPFGYDEGMLAGILMDARRCNARDGITGALVCRADIYLQMLEGPAEVVDAAFARIARDDRHVNVERLVAGPVTARLFGDWDMMHDAAHSWLWSRQQIADGVLARTTGQEIRDAFAGLSKRAKADFLA